MNWIVIVASCQKRRGFELFPAPFYEDSPETFKSYHPPGELRKKVKSDNIDSVSAAPAAGPWRAVESV
jgi:hypothetical protein